MHLVALQLELFPNAYQASQALSGVANDKCTVTDSERDGRTANQWLKSVVAYLEFRTGDAWRRSSNPKDRWSPDRLYYLDAIRLVNSVRGYPDFLPAPVRREAPKPLINRKKQVAAVRGSEGGTCIGAPGQARPLKIAAG